MKRALSVLVTCAVLGSLAACGRLGRGDGGQQGGRFAQMLAAIPDDEDHRSYVIMADFERARRSVDAPAPADDDAALRQLVELSIEVDGPLVASAGFPSSRLQEVDAWRRAFGFSAVDALAGFDAGVPPQALAGVVVDEPDAIDGAVHDDPEWRDELSVESHAGVEYYAWGEELTPAFDRVSPARPLGIGGRLFVAGDLVVRSNADDAIRASIDATKGGSLADDEGVRALVGALDAAGASTIYLTAVQDTLPPALGRQEAVARDGVPPAELLGGGHGIVDGEPVMVWAGLYRSDRTAEEAVPEVERVLAEASSLDRRPLRDAIEVVSVRATGRLVVAELRPADGVAGNLLLQFLQRRDVLYAKPA